MDMSCSAYGLIAKKKKEIACEATLDVVLH